MSYRCAIYNRKCELLILKSQNVGKVYVKPRLLKPKKTCTERLYTSQIAPGRTQAQKLYVFFND